jgi:hypothetical protein
MHPEDGELFDAIFFSQIPWRTRNLLYLIKKLYQNLVPDNRGKILGANTNTSIISKIGKMEVRRASSGDKTALAVQLKEKMGIEIS